MECCQYVITLHRNSNIVISQSKDNMTKCNFQNNQGGLYQEAYEHDACGVGMVVNIHGGKSHELVENALKVLENMEHRGAETKDKTGDGAGIMVQIPHEFILLQGIPVPEKGRYGTGLVFLPRGERQQEILSVMIEEIEREGLQLMHLRAVPTCPEVLGDAAKEVEPDIKQLFVTGVSEELRENFDRILYKVRKKIENRIDDEDFYICSLNSKNIVYKGMLTSAQLRRYFPDLSNPYFTSGLALVHSRFSTNTFPKWKLAQPFRLLAHNGEINTIRGQQRLDEGEGERAQQRGSRKHQTFETHRAGGDERFGKSRQCVRVSHHERTVAATGHGHTRAGKFQRQQSHQRRPQGIL